jgi:hypothetical protein
MESSVTVMADSENLSKTKALMGALMRMKPKPHQDMKVGKKAKKKTKPKKKPGK